MIDVVTAPAVTEDLGFFSRITACRQSAQRPSDPTVSKASIMLL